MKQQNASIWGGHHQQQHYHAVQNKGRNSNRPLGLSPSGCPPLQHQQSHPQNGSGMRAVFLGNPAGKRECAGTGVFLPRRIGTPEPRKKPGPKLLSCGLKCIPSVDVPKSDFLLYPCYFGSLFYCFASS